jgi:biotin carboxylase
MEEGVMTPCHNLIILNRWDDDFAKYHEYLDHARYRVAYITTAAGRKAVREDLAAGTYEVPSLDDGAHVRAAGHAIQTALGGVDRIIALSEFDLVQAALLRRELGVPGVDPEQVQLYRNKVAMKRRLQRAGLATPRFAVCEQPAEALWFAAEVGYPLILKPQMGAASQGVQKIESPASLLAALETIDGAAYECEEYVAGDILHVDGLVQEGSLAFIKASRYLSTCLDFNQGVPLGSVMIDNSVLNARIRTFTVATLRALELATGAFHLELFHTPDDELVFLEIGARVGGGEIPFLTKDLFGVDLVREWVKLQLGESAAPCGESEPVLGGFLMMPEPPSVPCRVIRCSSLVGRVPGLYKEIVPSPGQVLDGQGGYEHISGRFLFRGHRSTQVEAAVRQASRLFRIDCEPLAA